MPKNDKPERDPEGGGGHHEEVQRHQVLAENIIRAENP